MAKNNHEIIANLTGDQARSVLGRLVGRKGNIAKAVMHEALQVLNTADIESIGDTVFHSLDCIEVEACWDRSGKQRYGGYVSPDDAAFDLIEETLYPFLQEMRKYINLGFPLQAEAYCRGIILGLYRFVHESHSEFTDWCIDLPGSWADSVFDEWKRSKDSEEGIPGMTEFFEHRCPDWKI